MKKLNIILLVVAGSLLTFGFINESPLQEPKSGVTVGTNIGNKAPDLKFLNPEGKEMSLYSLKGKIVLLDFWASWCGPCRRENPNVVQTYLKYKDLKYKNAKGFTVFSVSLDNNRDAWVKAIAKDSLVWENHVSDLGGWQSKGAAIYGVNGIPAGFLIDGNGIIVAKGDALRGPGLESNLQGLLKSQK